MRETKNRWPRHILVFVFITLLSKLAGIQDAWCAEQTTHGVPTAAATIPDDDSPRVLTIVINRGIPILTNDPTPMISGDTDAPINSTVTVKINDVAYTTTVLSRGTWRLDWQTPLPQGTYTVSASVIDAIGRTGTTAQKLTIGGSGLLPSQPLVAMPEQPAALEEPADADFQALSDRWRIVPPPYEMNVKGSLLDPYNQNVFKGDLPIYGQNVFLNLTGVSDTLLEYRIVPTASGVSANNPGSSQFFGNRGQFFMNQNFVLSADLFKGDTAYRPIDWRVKGTIVGNINYLKVQENGIVNIDVRNGTDRIDGIASLQELFAEVKLADLSPNYDFVSVRGGIQPFNSDFRGFIFSDTNLGIRFFGNYESNRDQFNLVFFIQLEKDTNSGLNTFDSRSQRVLVANFYRQDFLVKGYTTQLSIHHLWDYKSFHFDENGFLARPDPVGSFTPHEIDATYLGWTSSGHFGWLNVTHALYYVLGEDSLNPIAGRQVGIEAYMAALELSYDHDWFRPKLSYFYASGDGDPTDNKAHGFDAILDNPEFAGGGFSFWNRLGIPLAGAGVKLINRGSLLPDLRSSKEEGQLNFVNPGLHLFNTGIDMELTPKLKALLNVNYLRFDRTETLELLLFQNPIHKEIGWDLSAGIRYRPFLNNNVIFLAGFAAFLPGQGFKDIYESGRTLYTGFTNLTFTF